MKFDLTVEVREQGGKGPARQLRRSGRVPAVLYGQGECQLLSVNPDELVKVLRAQTGATALISLTVNGSKSNGKRIALLRDYQALPDFIEVDASGLHINQGIHLKEIAKPAGLRFLDDPEHMIVSVAAPMTEAKLEALLTSAAAGPEAAKEPEGVAKGKAAAEAAAAGPEGAAAAAKPGAPAAAEAKPGAAAPKAEKKEPEKKK